MPGASTELAATESFPGRDRLRAWRPWPTCMEKTASGGKTTNFTGIYITGFHGDINGIYIYIHIYIYKQHAWYFGSPREWGMSLWTKGSEINGIWWDMMRYITNNVIFVFVCKWVSAPLRLLPLNNREHDEFYQIQWGFSPKQNFNHLAGFDPYTPCFQNLSNGINGQHPPVTLIGKLSGFSVAPSSKCHRFDPFLFWFWWCLILGQHGAALKAQSQSVAPLSMRR